MSKQPQTLTVGGKELVEGYGFAFVGNYFMDGKHGQIGVSGGFDEATAHVSATISILTILGNAFDRNLQAGVPAQPLIDDPVFTLTIDGLPDFVSGRTEPYKLKAVYQLGADLAADDTPGEYGELTVDAGYNHTRAEAIGAQRIVQQIAAELAAQEE